MIHYLMRHGETQWNREKRYQGQLDSPLAEEGLSRILLQKDKISLFNIKKAYCSPLGRAKNTLKMLIPGEWDIEYDHKLKEIQLGKLQGKTNTELNTIEQRAQRQFWESPQSFNLENAETLYDVENRVRSFLKELEQEESSCLIMTHTVVIKMILKILHKNDMDQLWEEPYLHPATIIKINTASENPVLEVIHPEEEMEAPRNYTA